MSEIQLFGFEGKDIRIIDKHGDPWFVATDICASWGIKNVSQAVAALDEDEKGICDTYTLGGAQSLLVISESGLYAMAHRSRLPVPKRFCKWVRSEVLPSIRKTGSYGEGQKEDGELVRYAREIERQRREMDLIRDAQIKMQAETIQALKIALEAKDVAQTASRDAKHAEEFCAWAPYAKSKGIIRTTYQASQDGKRLGAMCKSRGIERGKVTNERWESCYTYPRFVMDEYIEYYFRGGDGTEPIPMGV